MFEDRRRAERISVSIPASLRDSSGIRMRVTIDEISATGFRCEYVRHLEADTLLWVTLPSIVPLRVRPVRFNEFIYAFEFDIPLHEAVVDHFVQKFRR
ncbi:MAG: PilZ domain-containing protein [Alphaproteobacteria bacterium]|nr:PilZ domain-containing protein [Alphaproteobacteria bacterium]